MFHVSSLPLGAYRANCYLLSNSAGTFLVDPGAEPQVLRAVIAQLNVQGIILTHCHSDHIGCVNELREETGAPVYIGAADVAGAADPHISGFADEGSDYRVENIDVALHDGERITLGDDALIVVETPGHTVGSICLWEPASNRMFTGDTLFSYGYGRTDFATGDMRQMRESMRKLAEFDPSMHILPGHGPSTILGAEFGRNPLLVPATQTAFGTGGQS
ncbi:glyoxylase-like metal-dependent hydrolase (beta-lactamase superfamily II) [Arcanobacterium pluranimalium]|uniref:MBL fold metallo-hydrolase n=1 Tax=Arcanobacterium pluranimalium TaxID=108028 RepID=UPI00195BC681|nr:MBL fold metallo-hydrolase [Arcanobacterium pluranimalium]MBM7824789.1 glyoxylase-like metal-dependent hydrolase (beta-lactamase superfamily II) [Arcanobacterium pluranimalium]